MEGGVIVQRTNNNDLSGLNADKIKIEIKDESNSTISEISGEEEISLIHTKKYKDCLLYTSDAADE